MNEIIKFFVQTLLGQLIALIPEEWRTQVIDKLGGKLVDWTKEQIDIALDFIEDLVIQSENTIDDYVLHLTTAIRNILTIPDTDPKELPVKGEIKLVLKKENLSLVDRPYPTPIAKTKGQLYKIPGVYKKPENPLPGLIYFGIVNKETYFLVKNTRI